MRIKILALALLLTLTARPLSALDGYDRGTIPPGNLYLPLVASIDPSIPPDATATPTPRPTATRPTATATPLNTATRTPLPTSTPRPTAANTATATATAAVGYVCGYDAYNCSDFGTRGEAQAVYDYCVARGAGDVHRLDQDGDGEACEALP